MRRGRRPAPWILAGARLGLATALGLALADPTVAVAAPDFVVIVHPSVTGKTIRRSDLAAVYLRKATRWGAGVTAVPVDQSGTSAVRKAFSEAVLGMSVATVVQYWQSQAFATKPLRPPLVKNSDAEIVAFVARNEGAVGYVSSAAALTPEVKAISLTD